MTTTQAQQQMDALNDAVYAIGPNGNPEQYRAACAAAERFKIAHPEVVIKDPNGKARPTSPRTGWSRYSRPQTRHGACYSCGMHRRLDDVGYCGC